MTVFSFMKYALIFTSLLGFAFICAGAWKSWSSYSFTRHAEIKQGTFRGYHVYRYKSSTKSTSGTNSYSTVEEHLPMFSYKDGAGRRHEITGKDTHFFQHLKSKVNESVRVLVSPDNSSPPRLGDAFSLYSSGALLGLAGFIFFMLPLYGAKFIGTRIARTTAALAENPELTMTMFENFGMSRLPAADLVIILGGFFLIAGCMGGFVYYSATKRQNTSLIKALQDENYELAGILAAKGSGIDAKNSEGETALILAIRAGRSDIACSIINKLWVNTHARDADGASAIHLAAVNGDRAAVALLLKKGELFSDIKPAAIYHLIRKGDTDTLEFIINNGLDLNQSYAVPSYGDQAILEGRPDVVRLIQKHNGLFKAPPAFIALAADDTDALRAALEDPKTSGKKFRGLTLENFAEKIDRTDLLEKAGRI